MTKKIQYIVTILLLCLFLSACTDSVNDDTSSDDTVVQTGETKQDGTFSTASLTDETGFDIERILSSVVIEGIQVTMPFTLNDLGDDFTFENLRFEQEEEGRYMLVIGYLLYAGEERYKVGISDGVPIDCAENQEKLRDIPINIIMFYSRGNDNISIDGIVKGETHGNEIIDRWGEPPHLYDGGFSYHNVDAENRATAYEIMLNIDRNGILSDISIFASLKHN